MSLTVDEDVYQAILDGNVEIIRQVHAILSERARKSQEEEERRERISAAAAEHGYILKEVRGTNHTKACSECGKDEWNLGEFYVFDAGNPRIPRYTNKYCLECAEMAFVFGQYNNDEEDNDDDDDDEEEEEEEEVEEAPHVPSQEEDGDDCVVAEVLSFHEVQERKRKAAEESGTMVDLVVDANHSSAAASASVFSPSSSKKPKPAPQAAAAVLQGVIALGRLRPELRLRLSACQMSQSEHAAQVGAPSMYSNIGNTAPFARESHRLNNTTESAPMRTLPSSSEVSVKKEPGTH
ncbi:hypothetical protein RI054_27g113260 [Pseudoscourfieldia marina]